MTVTCALGPWSVAIRTASDPHDGQGDGTADAPARSAAPDVRA